MKKLGLRSKMKQSTVEVPVAFIDTFMPQASQDAVKVYLYLLRASQDPSIVLSLPDLADLFDVTANKIVQALTYWEAEGLILLDYDDDEIADIQLLPLPGDDPVPVQPAARRPENVRDMKVQEEPAVKEAVPVNNLPEEPVKKPEAPEKPLDISDLSDDAEFESLLQLAEYYMKKPLTSVQRNSLGFCYLMFDRQADVIEYLLEYCIEQGHTSIYYIEAVAKNWKNDGLDTLKEIRDAVSVRSKTVTSVAKAFGITGRSLVKDETDYIERWTEDFDLELVLEACRRTVLQAKNPSFKYADSILASWKEHQVETLADVEKLDRAYESAGKAEQKAPRKPVNNAFHNYDERKNNNYNELVSRFYES